MSKKVILSFLLVVLFSSAAFAWLISDSEFRGYNLKDNMRIARSTPGLTPYSDDDDDHSCRHMIWNMRKGDQEFILINLLDGAFLHISPSTTKGSEYEYEFAIKKVKPTRVGSVYHFSVVSGYSQEIRGPLLDLKEGSLQARGWRTAYNLPSGKYLLAVQRTMTRGWTSAYPSTKVNAAINISVTKGK